MIVGELFNVCCVETQIVFKRAAYVSKFDVIVFNTSR